MTAQSIDVVSARGSKAAAAWRGEASLAWAFWAFNVGGGILLWVVAAVGFLFLPQASGFTRR